MVTWKHKERMFPELTPELRKINELIAYGMKGKEIAQKFKEIPNTWLNRFKHKYKVPFVYYKKEILQRLENGTYE